MELGVFVVAAALVAAAELGDKTQMLSLLLATRYPARRVFLGVLVAVLALQLIATSAGRVIGDLIPQGALAVLTGALFIGFGVWTLRDASRATSDADEEAVTHGRSGLGPIAAVASAFFLAELGDKTQVLTFTVAADPDVAYRMLSALGLGTADLERGPGVFVAVWLGSALGMMLVNGVAILAGAAVGKRVSPVVIGRVSGVVFVLFGVAALASWLLAR